MKINEMIELMKHMKGNDIIVLETETNGTHLRLERSEVVSDIRSAENHQKYSTDVNTQPILSEPAATPCEDADQQVIQAPIVGVFYAAPSPENEPFVSVGSSVQAGDPLCIIEAMKLMNEVTCPCSGIVREIMVSDGERVEFGQPMIRIDIRP